MMVLGQFASQVTLIDKAVVLRVFFKQLSRSASLLSHGKPLAIQLLRTQHCLLLIKWMMDSRCQYQRYHR